MNRLLSSVDVPVVRDRQVSYVLSMQYFGERLGAFLERQQAPPGATVTIYDGKARIVWSSRARRTEVGRRASSALAAGFALGPEVTVDEPGQEGGGLVTVFRRSSLSAGQWRAPSRAVCSMPACGARWNGSWWVAAACWRWAPRWWR